MKCVICKLGETEPGHATVTLHRGTCTVIFKGVPADVCDNCGEYYVSDQVSGELLEKAEDAASKGAEIEVHQYAAA